MLNKIETHLMNLIYNKARGKGTVLMPLEEIFDELSAYSINLTDVEKILTDLAYDGYIDCVTTDKKGQFFFLITLKQKGEAFPRERLSQKREIYRRIILTTAFAVLSFVVGLILKKMV